MEEEATKPNSNKTAVEAPFVKVVSSAEGSIEQAGGKETIHQLLQLGGLENDKEDETMTENNSSDDEDGEYVEQRSPVKKKGRRKANFTDVIEYNKHNAHLSLETVRPAKQRQLASL